jgi:signal transduction histidine kinase
MSALEKSRPAPRPRFRRATAPAIIPAVEDREVHPMSLSLRRKLFVYLSLLGTMLLVTAGAGLWGLVSYWGLIRDLDFAINRAPRQSALTSRISTLFQPLLMESSVKGFHEHRSRQFLERLDETRTWFGEYRRQLEQLGAGPQASSRKHVADAILNQIEVELGRFPRWGPRLADPGTAEFARQDLVKKIAELVLLAERVPDPSLGIGAEIDRARVGHRWFIWGMVAATAIALVLFFALWSLGYRWVFRPISLLHKGARRVAQGDFAYRLSLESRDEMGELAEAFNLMTERFRAIRDNLDKQVRERSQQLVRSERMASVGLLASGVAHEINNPLQAIVVAAESIGSRLADVLEQTDADNAATIRRYLEMIRQESDRCRDITRKLLEFARGEQAHRAPADLAALVQEVLTVAGLLSSSRGKSMEFVRRAPCVAEVNSSQIKQVLLNIIANALDAMEPGGKLVIDAFTQADDVIVEIRDDGCGMTRETVDQIFEPFFTRQRNGQGTGLGLSISHRIVTEHGGTLVPHSDGPGKGSTFTIRLPRKSRAQAAA